MTTAAATRKAANAARTAARAAGQAAEAAAEVTEPERPLGPAGEFPEEYAAEYADDLESPWAGHFRRGRPSGDEFGHEIVIVRKKAPLPAWAAGKAIPLHTFDDPYSVASLEDEVKRLARDGGWGSGLYRFEARDGRTNRIVEPGVYETPIVLDGDAAALIPTPHPLAAAGPGLGVRDVFEVAEKIAPKPTPAPSVFDDLVKMKQAGMLPDNPDVTKWIPLATALLAGLKEVFQRPPDPVTTALLTKLATPDPLTTALLTKLADRALEPAKTAGLGDRLVGRVLDYALESGGGGERSLLGEVKDLLVGVAETEAGRNAGAGVRDVGAAILERVRGGGAPLAPRGPVPAVATPATPLPSGALHQVQLELAGAAQRREQSYFPVFVNRVRELFPQGGAQVLDAIAAGTMTDEQAFQQLEAVGFQLTPPVQSYLRWLMGWLRWQYRQAAGRPTAPAAPPTSGPNGTTVVAPGVGRCTQCGVEYEGEPAAFADPCDRCGGPIVAVEGPR